MTSNPPPRRPRSRPSKIARSEAVDTEPEKVSGSANPTKGVAAATERQPVETIRRRGARRYPCPMCGGQFVRVHRRFADRLLSLFNPVQRYRCTNHLCRHEAILRMNSALGQRPIVAAAGLAGAALAGLTFMGFGLYVADESTRAAVRGAYTSFVQRNVASRHDPTLALPEAAAIDESPGPQYEAAAILGAKAETDAPTVDFMPPLPNLAPATSPRAAEPNEVGPPQE